MCVGRAGVVLVVESGLVGVGWVEAWAADRIDSADAKMGGGLESWALVVCGVRTKRRESMMKGFEMRGLCR